MRTFFRLARDQRGATAIEYALLASLIGLAAIGGFKSVGGSSSSIMGGIESSAVPIFNQPID